VLAEFASVVDAVECAVGIQQVLRTKNALLPETRKMDFRIGINLGDVIEEGDSIYGDGVNIAARLEGRVLPVSVLGRTVRYELSSGYPNPRKRRIADERSRYK